MEIISIPLEGDLKHMDSMGNVAVIREGDIQVLSAGTGISHSEYNRNQDQEVKFLQIWIIPKEKGVSPRYDQTSIRELAIKNEFYQILSPDADDQGVWIHQDAWFHMGELERGQKTTYRLKKEANGLYLFVLQGQVFVDGHILDRRDALGIWETSKLEVTSNGESKVLLMEVPMEY
jgi:redox-sensitive bicupin YhaK (pirin superfamily)